MSFARTKIQAPRPRAGTLIARPALAARLGTALQQLPLVLLQAPAGFGKTALLAGLVQARGPALPPDVAVAWVGLDDGDDLPRLLECLAAALEPFDPPWRSDPAALAASASDPAALSAVLAEWINVLAATEVRRGVIVLDDLHRVDDQWLLAFVDRWLDRAPERWTIAITSRTEPALSLPRLRVAGAVAEFREADLRFAPDEAARLLPATLEPSDREALIDRLQGWPAGLRLALATLAAPGPRGAAPLARVDRPLFDYLASEVLDRLPEALRDFLLATSVLPEITAARGAALSGRADAAALMDRIEAGGLFVSELGEQERTLRLHDLFRDALEHRLLRDQPERLPMLLQRAAATESDLQRRLGYLLRAGDWAAAETELDAQAAALLTQGAQGLVQRALDRFPPDWRAASPRLARVEGLLAWAAWDWRAMPAAMARAAAGFRRAGDAAAALDCEAYLAVGLAGGGDHGAAAARLAALEAEPLAPGARARCLVAASWIALHEGRLADIGPLQARLVERLERLPALEAWYECVPLPAYLGLPAMRGPLQRYVDGVLRRAPDEPGPVRGLAWVLQGWLLAWAGQLDAADAALERADADCRWLGQPVNLRFQLMLARLALDALRGRTGTFEERARALLDDARGSHRRLRMLPALTLVAFHVGRMALLAGSDPMRAEALRILDDPAAGTSQWLAPEQLRALAAGRAEAEGRPDEALAGWSALAEAADRLDLFGQAAEARLRAAALQVRGRRLDAAAALLAPLLAAEPEPGVPLLAGPEVLARLAEAPWQGRIAAPERLAAWAERARAARQPAPAAAAGPAPGGLSEREREVLARIAAGDSNKLIARALELSPHTVKRHVANILDKIGVDSRGQAAAWLRQNA